MKTKLLKRFKVDGFYVEEMPTSRLEQYVFVRSSKGTKKIAMLLNLGVNVLRAKRALRRHNEQKKRELYYDLLEAMGLA